MLLDTLFKEVEKLQSEYNLNIVAYSDVVWSYNDGELSVNTQGDEDLLFNREGNTYSYDVRSAVESDDGYVIFYDADNCCGTRDTIIVKASERRE
jgi:hypothetical protein